MANGIPNSKISRNKITKGKVVPTSIVSNGEVPTTVAWGGMGVRQSNTQVPDVVPDIDPSATVKTSSTPKPVSTIVVAK